MAQFARPISDSENNWASGGWADIDESSASDVDFAYTQDNPTPLTGNSGYFRVNLGTGLTDPVSDTGHIVRWRHVLIDGGIVASDAGTGCDLDVILIQGASTTIASKINIALDAVLAWAGDSITLSAGEADSITDYTDLDISFDAAGGGGSPTNRRGAGVSWAEFETPDAASSDREAHITAFELEAENAPRKAHVTAVELEAEPAARQAHVTAVELEAEPAAREAHVTAVELAAHYGLLEVLPENIKSLPGFSHSRTGVATYVDVNGITQTAADGEFRGSHYIGGVRHWLPEGASENLVVESENFGNWTDVNTPVKTGGQADPFDGTAAYILEDNDGAANELVRIIPAFTGDGVKSAALYVRKGTATETLFQIRDATAAADRLHSTITWSGSVPSVAMAEGSLLRSVALTSNWYRLEFATSAITAANTNQIDFYPAGDTASATGTIVSTGVQAENLAFSTSYIATAGSAVTRNADSLSVDYLPVPQEMTVQLKGVELGTALASKTLFNIGTATTNEYIRMPSNGPGQKKYLVIHDNGPDVSISTSGANAEIGQTREIRSAIDANGAITMGESIDGAAEVVDATPGIDAAFTGAFSATTLTVGDRADGSGKGYFAFEYIRIAAGVQSMVAMRDLFGFARRAFATAYELEAEPAAREAHVTAVEVEVENAPRKAHVTAVELEAESAQREAHITAFELEAENAARKAHITALELESEIAARGAHVTALELEAASAPRKAHITALEFEAEQADRKAHVTALELEVENAPASAFVTAFEMEAAGAPRQAIITAFEMQGEDTFDFGPPARRRGLSLTHMTLGV